jgi:predicted acetyltransferase
MGYELRPIAADEVDAFILAAGDAFGLDTSEESLALWRRGIEPERTLAAFEGDAIVATSIATPFRGLTVPGGVVPMAGIAAVGVDPLHRGRGLLDGMMRGLLEATYERGIEPVAGLWASEAGIYGRYGYGAAERMHELTVRSPDARLRVPPPDRRPRAGEPRELLADLRTIHDIACLERPGMLAREDLDWDIRLDDRPDQREGAGRLRALVWDGPDGPAGYAVYAIRKVWTDHHPADVVELRELVALSTDAAAALWGVLLGLSLSRSIHWEIAAEDEILPHLLTDPRAVGASVRDALFVRLVDVPRALAARRYAAPVDVVLEVRDDVCGWNHARWHLAGDADGATCERTTDTAGLTLTATELGAAYLGGTTLNVLAAAGRVEAHRPGVLAAVSHAFTGPRAPWTPDQF